MTGREALLRRRAEALARASTGTDADAATSSTRLDVVVVEVGDELWALPSRRVGEIVPAPPLARVTGLPRACLGLCGVRGTLVGVFDPGVVVGRQAGRAAFVVVLADPRGPVGMACARVRGFLAIDSARLAPGSGVVAGVADDGLQLIDVDALLRSLEAP